MTLPSLVAAAPRNLEFMVKLLEPPRSTDELGELISTSENESSSPGTVATNTEYPAAADDTAPRPAEVTSITVVTTEST